MFSFGPIWSNIELGRNSHIQGLQEGIKEFILERNPFPVTYAQKHFHNNLI
jgi:hypothetical protein